MSVPNWYRSDKGGVRFYQAFHLHASGLVRHGYSTRLGGVSESPYDTLNLGLHTDDDLEGVRTNRTAFGAALGLDAARIVVPDQVHSDVVRRVTLSDAGAGALDHSTLIPGADALISNTPDVPLALHFADCVCIFLLDPVNKAIGLAHAGWKGTALKIVAKTIDAMSREFGTDPSQMIAAIGPAIGRCCYEVREDTARELFKAFPHDERVLTQGSVGKWRADLKTANRILLCQAGVSESNIAISGLCTCCQADMFFSYRRDGVTGRMAGWLSLL